VGVDLRGDGALERRVHGLACLQARHPLCLPGAHLPGLDGHCGFGGGRRRGLALRMDHGSQYLSDHFQNQLKHWGINPSFAFIEQPQTNGVAERFFRTLKEQVIYGRIFRNTEDVRQAVAEFVEIYNHAWRLERLGYMSPVEFRNSYLTKEAA
jgi:putative transposase